MVNNKNLAALRRQSGFVVFKAKSDQSISTLNQHMIEARGARDARAPRMLPISE
jgi:hypothetical protein